MHFHKNGLYLAMNHVIFFLPVQTTSIIANAVQILKIIKVEYVIHLPVVAQDKGELY